MAYMNVFISYLYYLHSMFPMMLHLIYDDMVCTCAHNLEGVNQVTIRQQPSLDQ